LGTGKGASVLEVIEAARQVTGRPIEARLEARRAGDPARRGAEPGRARDRLGWVPQLAELTTILRTAWEWQLAHPEGYAG
jgi:UDP-glucose 4-epimerase